MKKFTMTLALLLAVAMPMMAERVTPETARKVATTFLNNNGAKTDQLTDLSRDAGFPNLYIFTTEQGFVVMAADDCVQPILGYSLTGKFATENMPANVRGWLQGYNDEIQFAVENRLRATSETAQLWKDLAEGNSKAAISTVIVDALIRSTWDQDPGYNALCPYDSNAGVLTVTGCVATAVAQILRYWEYPTHGLGINSYTPTSHPEYGELTVNFGEATYNWADMPLHAPNNEIAKLMFHCGVAVNMDYDIPANGGSGASAVDILTALTTYFDYKSTATLEFREFYNDSVWLSMLKADLDASRPVEYNGTGDVGGHAFICDGYDSDNYFHFNWGWSGRNDGFYAMNNLVPGSGGSGGGGYSFNNNQQAVFGIEPMNLYCTAAVPSNFSIELEGRNAILTWEEASNAQSYAIYRNDVLIASTNDTSYIDQYLTYYTHAYRVRSMDANGSYSDFSETISVAIEPVVSNLTVAQQADGVLLTWVEPETDDKMLTYGDGNYLIPIGNYGPGLNLYFGHKYPASILGENKMLNKVSFYAAETGHFTLFVYTSSTSNSRPTNQITEQTVEVTEEGWFDIEFDPLPIGNNLDLWVFIYDPEGREAPIGGSSFDDNGENNGDYFSTDAYDYEGPTSVLYHISSVFYSFANTNIAFLIRTYITGDSFTYVLYDNNISVVSDLSGASYSLSSIADNTAHQFTLKTNFGGGETSPSNMAGLTIGDASLDALTLAANDIMTVTENSVLTVTGTLSDVNANNLILENGAQIINSSDGVQATVTKNISAYTQNGGWHLLASPLTDSLSASDVTGLLTNNFDLYTFNQSEELEWRNYEAQNFNIENKVGYLYANSGNPALTFTGSLAANVEATPLAYDENASFIGFNLIGNPYPCNAYVDRSFYVMNEDGSNFTLGSNPIPPCSAILVQAQEAGESVIFSKTASKSAPRLSLSVVSVNTRGNAIIDQARISFRENDLLEKFSLNGQNSSLYISQNGNDFAVACALGQTEMPVNFKVAENGTFILSIEAEDLELDYLHLIDNLTGNDVDLLTTPSYTFEAKMTDYASRFRLVFAPISEDADGDNAFAYISDGNIVINNEDGATLQIVDMMGRVVFDGDVSGNVSTSEMTPGVYVLRLTNGENVRTQKIVIE